MNFLLKRIYGFARIVKKAQPKSNDLQKAQIIMEPPQIETYEDQVHEYIQQKPKNVGIVLQMQELKGTLKKAQQQQKTSDFKERMTKVLKDAIQKQKFEDRLKKQQKQKLRDEKKLVTLQEKLVNLDVPKDILSELKPHQRIKKIKQEKQLQRKEEDKSNNNKQKQLSDKSFLHDNQYHELKEFNAFENGKEIKMHSTAMQKDSLPQNFDYFENEARQNSYRMKLILAQQDIMLNHIEKQSQIKPKTIKSQKKPVYKNKESSQNQVLKKSASEQQLSLIIRREKLLDAIKNQIQPKNVSFKISKDELIQRMYPQQIIQKAKTHKTSELSYFKKLIFNHEKETELLQPNRRQRTNTISQLQTQLIKKKNKQQKYVVQPKDNLYITKKQEEGLVIHENLQFYKDKALKQFNQKQNLKEQDKVLKKQAEIDLKKANKISDIFIDEVIFPKETRAQRKQIILESSFGVQQKRVNNIIARLDKLGFSCNVQQIKAISKEILFEDKAIREKQQQYQQYLHKKQKKNKMKDQLKHIHKSQLRDDLNFDNQTQRVFTLKQLRRQGSIQTLQQNIRKYKEHESQQMSVLKQQNHEQFKTRIHHIKTFKNIQRFLNLYFGKGMCNRRGPLQLQFIQIKEYIPNRTNTVINIFWLLQPKYLERIGVNPGMEDYQDRFDEVRKQSNRKLKKQSGYISGKMTQVLGLRYGPSIRFIYDQKTKQTQSTIQELSKYRKEIAMLQVQEMKKKGLIKTQQKQKEYFRKMLDVANNNLYQYSNRKELLSKNYRIRAGKENHQEKQQARENNRERQRQKELEINGYRRKHNKNKNKKIQHEFQMGQKQEMGKNSNRNKKQSPVDKLWSKIELL